MKSVRWLWFELVLSTVCWIGFVVLTVLPEGEIPFWSANGITIFIVSVMLFGWAYTTFRALRKAHTGSERLK